MIRTIKNILLRPIYLGIFLGIASTAFAFMLWLPNLSFISSVFGNMSISWIDKVIFLLTILGSITTNFTIWGAFSTILIALLFGMQIALTVYLLREHSLALAGTSTAASSAGVGIGLLGIGCSACGSIILTAILPAIGASGFLAFLPFGGAEFSLLGVLVMMLSLFFTVHHIMRPALCDSKPLTP